MEVVAVIINKTKIIILLRPTVDNLHVHELHVSPPTHLATVPPTEIDNLGSLYHSMCG